ncbi:cystathione beta-lyase [Bifidobacterium bohemicum]|uniref:cysteine-S-conjugate beta-lyase n=1 Tax=Bifidobacterium bohemicum DSM 22767 TaxID=1437606 RepID=A0A086ZJT4_9BIFI|nr:MalY/PatB family protein [Bifidobacterium bohemicum]KFI46784.1 aminotransferase [Bifidobacterium bohemicum DSM 22767]SCB81387.1 cystathione beta-lyase [Bifidobacterium bohemicum]
MTAKEQNKSIDTRYDFTHAPERRGSASVKWDVGEGELPMWIADMDFATAPEIIKQMRHKLDLGAFGYEEPGEAYFNAVADWYDNEHHARPETDWMLFATGVVPAISSIVRRVGHVGDNVLVTAPVYNIFYNSIENNGRHVLSSDLVYHDGAYDLDFDDLEAKLAEPLTTLMVFCNPHNPTGKVWTREELERVAQLCAKHHVVMLSDEIHGDLVLSGPDYTPAFSLSPEARSQVISLVSPSKTFNVAALHAATAIIPDSSLRAQVNRGLNSDEVAEPNLLALDGTIAAYAQGREWVAALRRQLRANRDHARAFIGTRIEGLRVVESAATYLMWIDASGVISEAPGKPGVESGYNPGSDALAATIREQTGLILSSGSIYRGNGSDFLRLNFACPPDMLDDGLERLERGVRSFKQTQ